MPHLRRLAGAALLVAAYAPVHRLLDPGRTGPAGAATRVTAEVAWTLGISGTVIVVTFCWVCVRMVPAERLAFDSLARSFARIVSAPSSAGFAAGLGLAVTALTAGVARTVHDGGPTTVDEMAQLLHAGALSAGSLSVPWEGSAASWIVQNGVLVEGGWASIYPPLHTLLLAVGLTFGAAWLVGPLMTGLTTALVVLAGERLMGAVAGRTTGLLLAVSPFWILLGATHLSHTSAAAGIALVLLGAVRAREGGNRWAVITGVGMGAAVCSRPWLGLVCSAAIIAAAWRPLAGRGASADLAATATTTGLTAPPETTRLATRAGAAVLGGAPFAALLFAWNYNLFGSPLRLGYTAAFGPAHGLGLHTDPWGNRYGLVEALAYTGADLTQLGVRLLESPIPALAVLGTALLVRPLRSGSGVFAAWAAAAVAANAPYWHHGIHMGPRMLYESAPAWVALLVAAAAPLFDEAGRGSRTTGVRLARWSLVVALLAGLVLAPAAARAPTASAEAAAAGAGVLEATREAASRQPIVVFVHGSWSSRVAARLAAGGMRRDSIETALRRNDICEVDRYARLRGSPNAELPELDLDPQPGTPPHLESRALSDGNLVRVSPTNSPDAPCLRQARSDRMGVLELELIAWRAPPMPGTRALFLRDLGPEGNLATLEALERTAYLYVDAPDGALLLEYDEGIELLWGDAGGASPPIR